MEKTALMYTVENCKYDIVKLLLEYRTDPKFSLIKMERLRKN